MNADSALHLVSRFIHISSVIILLGAIVYSRLVLVPALNDLPEPVRVAAAQDLQKRFRQPLFSLLALIVGSGLYNFFTGPKHQHEYQVWFGIKMLLVAHIVSSAILWGTSPYGDVTVEGKAKRRLVSLTISGLLVVLISAYLRSLTLRGL